MIINISRRAIAVLRAWVSAKRAERDGRIAARRKAAVKALKAQYAAADSTTSNSASTSAADSKNDASASVAAAITEGGELTTTSPKASPTASPIANASASTSANASAGAVRSAPTASEVADSEPPLPRRSPRSHSHSRFGQGSHSNSNNNSSKSSDTGATENDNNDSISDDAAAAADDDDDDDDDDGDDASKRSKAAADAAASASASGDTGATAASVLAAATAAVAGTVAGWARSESGALGDVDDDGPTSNKDNARHSDNGSSNNGIDGKNGSTAAAIAVTPVAGVVAAAVAAVAAVAGPVASSVADLTVLTPTQSPVPQSQSQSQSQSHSENNNSKPDATVKPAVKRVKPQDMSDSELAAALGLCLCFCPLTHGEATNAVNTANADAASGTAAGESSPDARAAAECDCAVDLSFAFDPKLAPDTFALALDSHHNNNSNNNNSSSNANDSASSDGVTPHHATVGSTALAATSGSSMTNTPPQTAAAPAVTRVPPVAPPASLLSPVLESEDAAAAIVPVYAYTSGTGAGNRVPLTNITVTGAPTGTAVTGSQSYNTNNSTVVSPGAWKPPVAVNPFAFAKLYDSASNSTVPLSSSNNNMTTTVTLGPNATITASDPVISAAAAVGPNALVPALNPSASDRDVATVGDRRMTGGNAKGYGRAMWPWAYPYTALYLQYHDAFVRGHTHRLSHNNSKTNTAASSAVDRAGAADTGDSVLYNGGLPPLPTVQTPRWQWEALPPLQSPRAWPGAAVLDGRAYVAGGHDRNTTHRVRLRA